MSCSCGCGGACGVAPTLYPITNASGLPQLSYRAGTFATFRRRLLESLPGETELSAWQPSAGTDLGLQVLDWWAYIADILTFYNERIANEDYLGTAQLGDSVTRLISVLGYRPRPGIGSVAQLAVLASKSAPLVVPTGFAIASKASPDVPVQTFETTSRFTFQQPTSVPGPSPDDLNTPTPVAGPANPDPGAAQVAPHQQLVARGGVLLKGTPSTIAVNDELLLLRKDGTTAAQLLVKVSGLVVEKDADGRRNTRALLASTSGIPSSAKADDYRLTYSTHTSHLASMPAGAVPLTSNTITLDAPARYLTSGEPVVIAATGTGADISTLTGYSETVWYANADDPANHPDKPPASSSTPGIPIVVGVLALDTTTNLANRYKTVATQVSVRSGWRDAGTLIDTPVRTLNTIPTRVTLAAKPAAQPGVATTAMLEDANGKGAMVTATPDPSSTDVDIAGASATLEAPLRVLWDLIDVSRGTTVRDENLGTGDATQSTRDFTLAKSPVTYLTDFPGRSGDGYSSTIVLSVDGRYWTEVPTLYGHEPTEAVFETYEDEQGKTHIRTGLLPTGAPVIAQYRIGSGAAVPAAGDLTQVLNAVPNLRSVRNPVTPVGGSDPQSHDDVRRLAPRSVLTFGRAISGDDYQAVAAAAPGVSRAAAVWEWDAQEQRPTVRVYVGDDDAAVTSARTALRAQSDPNRPLIVVPAVRQTTRLRVVLRLDPTYVADAVYAKVRAAVNDQIFAPGVLTLGEPLYRSLIEDVITNVPGVIATHDLQLRWHHGSSRHKSRGPRFHPGPGGFFDLTPTGLSLSEEDSGD